MSIFERAGRNANGCLIWRRSKTKQGYGITRAAGGYSRLAHRRAWEEVHGPIPEGMQVCHSCDVRLCIEPSHLFLGTHADNMNDMTAKGRQARGQRQHLAKLMPELVKKIREAAGPQTKIAAEFGVHQSQVSRILLRRTWKHI